MGWTCYKRLQWLDACTVACHVLAGTDKYCRYGQILAMLVPGRNILHGIADRLKQEPDPQPEGLIDSLKEEIGQHLEHRGRGVCHHC